MVNRCLVIGKRGADTAAPRSGSGARSSSIWLRNRPPFFNGLAAYGDDADPSTACRASERVSEKPSTSTRSLTNTGHASPEHAGSSALSVKAGFGPQPVGVVRPGRLPPLAAITKGAEEPTCLTHVCRQPWQRTMGMPRPSELSQTGMRRTSIEPLSPSATAGRRTPRGAGSRPAASPPSRNARRRSRHRPAPWAPLAAPAPAMAC